MSFCTKCGKPNRKGALFCEKCGESLSGGHQPSQPAQSAKKECSICHGTGIARHPTGMKVPCPNGCPGFYPH